MRDAPDLSERIARWAAPSESRISRWSLAVAAFLLGFAARTLPDPHLPPELLRVFPIVLFLAGVVASILTAVGTACGRVHR